LEVKKSTAVTRVKNNLIQSNTLLYGPELEEVANQAVEEYDLHIKGVKTAFNGFVYEYNAVDKA
jgi:hypothetical protein